jgi:ABC-type Zn uptake system ZnuABC Zn-binding protein ZnuA
VYQPTASDAPAFADADVVFANGADLETWLERLARNTRPSVRIVRLGEIPEITARPGDESTSLGDSHVWTDPTNAEHMVAATCDALASLDPNNQSAYQQNSAYDIRQIEELDREIMAQWATVPRINASC